MKDISECGIQILDAVDTIDLPKEFVGAILLSVKYFKTAKFILTDELIFEEADLEDIDWVMKHAGCKGKSSTEQFADAVWNAPKYKQRWEFIDTNRTSLLEMSAKYVVVLDDIKEVEFAAETFAENCKAMLRFSAEIK